MNMKFTNAKELNGKDVSFPTEIAEDEPIYQRTANLHGKLMVYKDGYKYFVGNFTDVAVFALRKFGFATSGDNIDNMKNCLQNNNNDIRKAIKEMKACYRTR